MAYTLNYLGEGATVSVYDVPAFILEGYPDTAESWMRCYRSADIYNCMDAFLLYHNSKTWESADALKTHLDFFVRREGELPGENLSQKTMRETEASAAYLNRNIIRKKDILASYRAQINGETTKHTKTDEGEKKASAEPQKDCNCTLKKGGACCKKTKPDACRCRLQYKKGAELVVVGNLLELMKSDCPQTYESLLKQHGEQDLRAFLDKFVQFHNEKTWDSLNYLKTHLRRFVRKQVEYKN